MLSFRVRWSARTRPATNARRAERGRDHSDPAHPAGPYSLARFYMACRVRRHGLCSQCRCTRDCWQRRYFLPPPRSECSGCDVCRRGTARSSPRPCASRRRRRSSNEIRSSTSKRSTPARGATACASRSRMNVRGRCRVLASPLSSMPCTSASIRPAASRQAQCSSC